MPSFLQLSLSVHAWGTPSFEATLKQELAQHATNLPLQQGLARSNYVADEPITVMIHRVDETSAALHLKVGISYRGVLGGCSCADDPTSTSDNEEYCVLLLEIDKLTAIAAVALVE